MSLIASAVLAFALTFLLLLFRRESCQERRRYWRQMIAISGFLLLAALARAVVSGDSGCGFEWPPSMGIQNKWEQQR
jgi:hypothetical protein